MSLKQTITDDMKNAMRAGEKARLAAVRLLLAAIKQLEVDQQSELSDQQILTVVEKLCKQRKDSIQQYQSAGRDDLVQVEQFELDVLQAYLPEQLDDAAIDQAVTEAIAETAAASMKDMGKVMGVLKSRLAGKADMAAVSARLKAQLTGG